MKDTFSSEEIFTSYIQGKNIKVENVEYGKDFMKFRETATDKTFIIMVREELPGKKIIVTERSKEKRVKVKSKYWPKPI